MRCAEKGEEGGEGESGSALALEEEVAEERAGAAGPVVGGECPGGVEGWVGGAIGDERQGEEDGGEEEQEAEKLMRAAGACGPGCERELVHG